MPVCSKCNESILRTSTSFCCSSEDCSKIFHDTCVVDSWRISAHQICCCFKSVKTNSRKRLNSAPQTTVVTTTSNKRDRSPPSPSSARESKLSRLENSNNQTLAMGDDQAPAWFTKFEVSFEAYKSQQSNALTKFSERLQNLETKLDKVDAQEVRISEQGNHIESLRTEINILKQDLKAELTISGIPEIVTLAPKEIVTKLLTKFNAPELLPAIIDVREMVKLQNNDQASSNPPRRPFRSIAVKMSSTACKDAFISKRSALKNLKSIDIFGSGGDAPIFVREIWPKPVYELWRKANVTRKELNYHRAFVKNLSVFIVESNDSQPILIANVSDLAKLQPRVPAN